MILLKCPHCRGKDIRKLKVGMKHTQAYFCNNCKRTFKNKKLICNNCKKEFEPYYVGVSVTYEGFHKYDVGCPSCDHRLPITVQLYEEVVRRFKK